MSTLKTRIKLKYDTLTNWTTNDPVLLAGEMAIVDPGEVGKDGLATVLLKVGDGTKKFSELDYTWAKAADVYGWAKASTKPSYDYSEIKNTPATFPLIAGENVKLIITSEGYVISADGKVKTVDGIAPDSTGNVVLNLGQYWKNNSDTISLKPNPTTGEANLLFHNTPAITFDNEKGIIFYAPPVYPYYEFTNDYQLVNKQYVDEKVTGATQYLGTVSTQAELDALTPGKGDFLPCWSSI